MTNPVPDQPANNIKKLTVTQMFLVWLLPIPFAIPIAFSKDHSRAATWYSRIILSLLALVLLSAIFGSNPKGTSPIKNNSTTDTATSEPVLASESPASDSLPSEFNGAWVTDVANCVGAKTGESDAMWVKIDGSTMTAYGSSCEIRHPTVFIDNVYGQGGPNVYNVYLDCSSEGALSTGDYRLRYANAHGHNLVVTHLSDQSTQAYGLCD